MNMADFHCLMWLCIGKTVSGGSNTTILRISTFLGPSRNLAPGRNFEFHVTTKKHVFFVSAPGRNFEKTRYQHSHIDPLTEQL